MINIRLLTLLFLSWPACGLAQNYNDLHSWKQLLDNSREDTSKALLIADITDFYLYNRPDSCIYYGNMGLELIRDESTKERFRNSNNQRLYGFEMNIYRMIATALAEQRNDALAVKMSLKSLELAEMSKDKYDVVRIYPGVAEVYQFVGEPAIAIKYLKKKISLDTSARNRQSYGVVLGTCFFDLGEYDSALYYFKGIDPFFTIGDNHLWSYPHLYLGKTYAKKKDYQKALGYYRTAINFALLSNFIQDLCDAKMGIADLYRILNMGDSAIVYAKSALQQSKNASVPDRTLVASSFLASIYDARNEKDSAIKFLKESAVLSDSLHNGEKIKQIQNLTFDEQLRQREIIAQQTENRNKIRFYVLLSGILGLLAIALILYRNNKNKQKLNAVLRSQKDEIQSTLTDLRSTQSQLVQSEKMASLGEMAAGIAHEIQNPLNFINNFSDLNKELLDEMKEEIKKGNYTEVNGMAASVIENEEKINHHGKRADAIVKGMLRHSQAGAGLAKKTNVNALADEYLRLAYHGMRAKDDQFQATMKTDFDAGIGEIDIIPQDMGRALINLFNNAFYSVNEKRKKTTVAYSPSVSLTTKKSGKSIFITLTDNGTGIPQNIMDKIFQPFFTTKPTGQGTGLGLSISYDIVKAHGGQIKVETKDGEETKFIIELPSA